MTKDSAVLVERRLRMKEIASGREADVIVQIGHPKVVNSEGDADCPVAVRGLFENLPDIRGIDALDALRLAIDFVERLLENKAKEFEFYWPNGEEYVGRRPQNES